MSETTPEPANPAQAPVTPPATSTPAPVEAHGGGVLRKVVVEFDKVVTAVEDFAADHGLDAGLAEALRQKIAGLL